MRRDRQEIMVWRDERGRQRASRPHLPDAEETRDDESSEGNPQMGQRELFDFSQTTLPSASGRKLSRGTTRTVAHIWLWPNPQNSWQGINRSPVLVKTV